LERAWQRSFDVGWISKAAAAHWSQCMWPWETTSASSAADGILDDETYDWLPDRCGRWPTAMVRPSSSSEAQVLEANELLVRHTDIDASATGTAGLAGVIAVRDQVGDDERVAVVLSGLRR
jgi:threonine synthase